MQDQNRDKRDRVQEQAPGLRLLRAADALCGAGQWVPAGPAPGESSHQRRTPLVERGRLERDDVAVGQVHAVGALRLDDAVAELFLIEPGVDAIDGEQLAVGAGFDDPAVRPHPRSATVAAGGSRAPNASLRSGKDRPSLVWSAYAVAI